MLFPASIPMTFGTCERRQPYVRQQGEGGGRCFCVAHLAGSSTKEQMLHGHRHRDCHRRVALVRSHHDVHHVRNDISLSARRAAVDRYLLCAIA